MRRAVFFDRDGTLIEHVHYLSDPGDVRLVPDAGAALRALRDAGYALIVVTNQSAIGRGMFDEAQLHRIHARMVEQLDAESVMLDDWRFCPTAPSGDDRTVIEDPRRKPGPGMLLESAEALDVDLGASWMIGDMISDVLAGQNAGCRGNILVRTPTNGEVDASHDAVTFVVRDLQEAAERILAADIAQRDAAQHSGRPVL